MINTFSDFFKYKPIFLNNNEIIGDITSLLYNIEKEKIIGCIYKKSFLQFNYFLLEDLKIDKGKFFILKEKEVKNHYYEIIGKVVKNQDQQIIGTVEDIDFSFNYSLENIYIFSGFNLFFNKSIGKKILTKISRKHIISYNNDYILINDKSFLKENQKILENIEKVFINIPGLSYNIIKNKYEL